MKVFLYFKVYRKDDVEYDENTIWEIDNLPKNKEELTNIQYRLADNFYAKRILIKNIVLMS